jgi:hypothetical protein
MATQGQISITNTNLSGGSYNFEIYVRECGSGSWGSPIDTIPYSGFPYFFNVEQVLSGSVDCFEYLVEEPTTLAQCTGQVYITTPTPTPTQTSTPTRTPTPTNTPTPSSVTTGLTLTLRSEYTSGSTVATYTIYSNSVVTGDTYFEFVNTLKSTAGTEFDLYANISIPAGFISGSTSLRLPTKNYSDVEKNYSVISNFVSDGTPFVVDRYGIVKFEGSVIPNALWIYRPCCDGLPNIGIQVPLTATQQGGWVANGGIILYNGNCYRPFGPGGDGLSGFYSGPDALLCSDSICPACTTTPTPTPTVTRTSTQTPTPTSTPTIPCSDCTSDFIDCAEAMGCYSYIAEATPTPSPSVTPTITPTISLTPTQTPTPTVTPTTLPCLDPDVEGYSFDSPQ